MNLSGSNLKIIKSNFAKFVNTCNEHCCLKQFQLRQWIGGWPADLIVLPAAFYAVVLHHNRYQHQDAFQIKTIKR